MTWLLWAAARQAFPPEFTPSGLELDADAPDVDADGDGKIKINILILTFY